MVSRSLSIYFLLLLAVMFTGLPVDASEVVYRGPALVTDYMGPVLVDNSWLRYPASEKLSFRTLDYLNQYEPSLLPLRPTIDSWAARLGIHPRVIATMAAAYFQDRAVVGDTIDKNAIKDLAAGLAEVFWTTNDDPLAASRAVDAVDTAFDLELTFPEDWGEARPDSSSRGVPPTLFGYFQPPWERGDTWAGGGAHGDTGTGPQNALDHWGEFRTWGQSTSQWWVAAMQAGTVRVWSSCSLTVIHPGGWETSLYHLDNIQVADFAEVARDTRLANYADNEAQALCGGGFSSGPHVHMAVYHDGNRVLVDEANLDFTAYSFKIGMGQYDTDCSRSYYTHHSLGTVCPNVDSLLNDAPEFDGLIFVDGFESGNTSQW